MARHDSGNEITLMSQRTQDADESSFPLQEEESNLVEVEDVSSPPRRSASPPANQRQSSAAQPQPPETLPQPASKSSNGVAGWKPQVVAPNKNHPIVEKLLKWGSENGWHDIMRRLLDAGKTDYAQYALYEKEMTAVPGQKDCFHHKGRVLKLIGMNRQNPRRLVDDYTKEVIVGICRHLRVRVCESMPGMPNPQPCLIVAGQNCLCEQCVLYDLPRLHCYTLMPTRVFLASRCYGTSKKRRSLRSHGLDKSCVLSKIRPLDPQKLVTSSKFWKKHRERL